jgi:hypothetical protein
VIFVFVTIAFTISSLIIEASSQPQLHARQGFAGCQATCRYSAPTPAGGLQFSASTNQ